MSDAAYDVFISYARRDSARAHIVRDALAGLGLRVFFDTEGVDTGEEFPVIIDRAVKSAKCVLGLWSRDAFTGRWVRIESRIGLDQNKLVAATLDSMQPNELPAEFYNVNVVSLADFDGESGHEGWSRIMRAIGKRVGRADLGGAPIVAAEPSGLSLAKVRPLHMWVAAGALAAFAIAIAAPKFSPAPSPVAASTPQMMTALSASDLSGAWTGAYTEAGRETQFEVQLERDGGSYAGHVSEPDIYGIAGGRNFTADVRGEARADGSVRLTKTYGGSGAMMRAVVYDGTLSTDGRSIAGAWDNGALHGTFHMERR